MCNIHNFHKKKFTSFSLSDRLKTSWIKTNSNSKKPYTKLQLIMWLHFATIRTPYSEDSHRIHNSMRVQVQVSLWKASLARLVILYISAYEWNVGVIYCTLLAYVSNRSRVLSAEIETWFRHWLNSDITNSKIADLSPHLRFRLSLYKHIKNVYISYITVVNNTLSFYSRGISLFECSSKGFLNIELLI